MPLLKVIHGDAEVNRMGIVGTYFAEEIGGFGNCYFGVTQRHNRCIPIRIDFLVLSVKR
jgi:hypothetical protein